MRSRLAVVNSQIWNDVKHVKRKFLFDVQKSVKEWVGRHCRCEECDISPPVRIAILHRCSFLRSLCFAHNDHWPSRAVGSPYVDRLIIVWWNDGQPSRFAMTAVQRITFKAQYRTLSSIHKNAHSRCSYHQFCRIPHVFFYFIFTFYFYMYTLILYARFPNVCALCCMLCAAMCLTYHGADNGLHIAAHARFC